MTFMILSLLVTITLPRLQTARRRTYVGAMRSDLRTLGLHQESYYYDKATYTDDLTALQAGGYYASPGVTVIINEATNTGWSGTAQHLEVLTECYVFVGSAAPVGSATVEGAVDCM